MNPIPARLLYRPTFSPQDAVSFCLSIAVALALGLVIYNLLDVSLGSIFSILFVSGLLGIGFNEFAKTFRTWMFLSFSLSVGCCSPMILGMGFIGYTLGDILGFVLMTWTVCGGMMSMTLGLGRWIGHGPGSGLSLTLFLGWLTWPVWMSPYFHTPWGQWCVDHLLDYQPLFALSSLFPEMGDWSHAPIAYAYLTNLGQDVMYALPPGVGKGLVFHGVLAGMGGLIAFWTKPPVLRPTRKQPS